MLGIELHRRAGRFLERLPPKHQKQVALKIAELRSEPEPPDSKVLKGKLSVYRRADIGEYRIVYRVEGTLLRIFLIGKRNDGEIYKRLQRLNDQ